MEILITESSNYSTDAIKIYEKYGKVKFNYKRDKIYPLVEVLIIRLSIIIDKDLIEHFPKLKYIVTPTTGLNHIKIKEKNIKVISLKGETAFLDTITPTSELSWALLQVLNRKLFEANKSVLKGNWDRDKFITSSLSNKTIGIIGYGRLGRQIEKYANAFGMHVIKHDINTERSDTDLDELMKVSDFINISVDLNEKSVDLITLRELSLMKKTSIIINTSRAEILNEDDLLYALEKKYIAGAGLDVLLSETKNSPSSKKLKNYMKKNDNLLITPHIGGACRSSMRKTEYFCAKKFEKIYVE